MAKRKKAPSPKPLSGDQMVAYGIYRQARDQGAPPRDDIPLSPWLAKLTRRFNTNTGQSLSKKEFWKLALSVLKIRRSTVEDTMDRAGLKPTSKSAKE